MVGRCWSPLSDPGVVKRRPYPNQAEASFGDSDPLGLENAPSLRFLRRHFARPGRVGGEQTVEGGLKKICRH